MERPSIESFWEVGEPIRELPTLNPSRGSLPQPQMVNSIQDTVTKKQSGISKAFDVGKKIAGTIAQPFVSVAATPVQGIAKLLGQEDPYKDFAKETGLPAQPSPIDQPLRKVGEAGIIASYAFPYARFARLGTLPNILGGALGGYGTDVSVGLSEGERFPQALKPGLGTALGTAIPGAGLAKNVLGRISQETLGVTTGASYGVIRQAFDAAKQGGKALEDFTEALRGRISPDAIVDEARSALSQIAALRRNEYVQRLETLKGNTQSLDISPIISELNSQLGKFRVRVNPEGLDFSQSAIRFDKEAQREVQTIVQEMKNFGLQAGDRTVIGVDSLKRALGDLYSKSSNVRALVASVKNKTNDVLKQVEGYEQMTKDYAEKSDLVNEIMRGLSLSDQAQIDTTYKKLISSLRLNNEQRKEMIDSLDQFSGGNLSSKIAGQQLSEALPRGIMRPLGAAFAGGAALTGTLIPLLKFAAFASPRLVGETLRVLGFSDAQAAKIIQAIGGIETLQRSVVPLTQSGHEELQTTLEEQAPAQGEESPRVPLEQFQL